MANILIREIDNTAYLNRQITNDNIVVVAGSSDGSGSVKSAKTFELCRSLREFYSKFGAKPLKGDELGWEYAANIIRAGFPVLYYAYYIGADATEAKSALTDSGTKLYKSDNVTKLSDKILYRIKFLPSIYKEYETDIPTIQSIVEGTDSGVGDGSGRGDCLILADFPEGVQDATSDSYTPKLAASITGSSYTIVPSPSAELVSPITGNTIVMPPSFWILKTMAEGVSSGLPIWSIWAGAKRGVISDVQKFSSVVTNQTMRDWTESLATIPLMNIPPYGNLIFGNSTRLHVGTIDDEETTVTPPTQKSALDSLNVRLVANEIKRSIFEICLGLQFDSNDVILWNEFKEKLIPILDGMKAGRGLNDYLILMDETVVTNEDIDALTVPGIVKVDIPRAAENFDITFELTPTGAVFDGI